MLIPLTPKQLTYIIKKVDDGTLSELNAKKLLGYVMDNNIEELERSYNAKTNHRVAA